MNRFLPNLLLIAAATLLPACLGSKAKDDVLFPPMNLAWPGVQADIERGIDDAAEDGDIDATARGALEARVTLLDQALGKRDVVKTRASWYGDDGEPTLRSFADRGIADRVDDGEIGEGVAVSLRKRLEQFNAAVAALPLWNQ